MIQYSDFMMLLRMRVALTREYLELNLWYVKLQTPQEELDVLREQYNNLHAELTKKIEDHPRYKEIHS